jgi:hypothetical protein
MRGHHTCHYGGPYFGPRGVASFLESLHPNKKNRVLIFTKFSKMTTEAKVIFFSGRGQTMLLYGRRRGEFDTIITTITPLA